MSHFSHNSSEVNHEHILILSSSCAVHTNKSETVLDTERSFIVADKSNVCLENFAHLPSRRFSSIFHCAHSYKLWQRIFIAHLFKWYFSFFHVHCFVCSRSVRCEESNVASDSMKNKRIFMTFLLKFDFSTNELGTRGWHCVKPGRREIFKWSQLKLEIKISGT